MDNDRQSRKSQIGVALTMELSFEELRPVIRHCLCLSSIRMITKADLELRSSAVGDWG